MPTVLPTGAPLFGDSGSRVPEILALQRTAGNAAVQRLIAVQRQETDSPPKPPFRAGQTITLPPPPLTTLFKIDLELKGSQQTEADPETNSAESKLQGGVSVSF